MHISTIMTVALLSMMPQISLGSAVTEDMKNKQQTQQAAETPEQITTEQTTKVPTAQQIPTIPAPPAQVSATTSDVEEPAKQTEVEIETTELAESPEETEEVTQEIVTQPATKEPSLDAAAMEIPKPIKEEPIMIPEEQEMEAPAGIDTVSLENPQGNWLYKRIWWERAEERYEKIRLLVDAIWESRTIFFVKRNELDRNVLDPFYLNVGIGQGELQTILSELVDFFEKHREKQGDLNEQERSLFDTIAAEEEALKQLKQDIESIANLDHAIDDALGTLMNQINRVRQYERQAWENFKEIAHILNDTKARELYYMIEGAARNIKNISSYVEQDFFNHFSKLIDETTKHINRVQNQMESLKEKGVSFKHQTELLAQKQEQLEDEEEEEDVAPKPKLSWFGWIMSWFTDAFDFIFSIIRMPYDMIFGK